MTILLDGLTGENLRFSEAVRIISASFPCFRRLFCLCNSFPVHSLAPEIEQWEIIFQVDGIREDSVVDEGPWYATPSIVSMTLLKWGRLRRSAVSLCSKD